MDAKERIAEPIPLLPLAQANFPANHADAEQAEAEEVEPLRMIAYFRAFGLQIIGIAHDGAAHEEG